MNIIKDILGNILLMNGHYVVRKWADIATDLILNGDSVVIKQSGVDDYAMYASDINYYQVLPEKSVYFSGSASQLLDVLVNNIFSTTTVCVFGCENTGIDFPYATAQWHSFTENYDATTTRSLDANFFIGYQVLIKKEVTLSNIAGRYTAGIAGACVVGVYTTGSNGHPDTKLFQSAAAFNNASAGVQQVSISGGNVVVPAGLYWVLYLSSSTPTAAALNQNIFINASGYNSAMNAPNSVWFRSLAYTATLPDTAGVGALGNNGGAIPFFTFLTV
jgi:hypothetical protein